MDEWFKWRSVLRDESNNVGLAERGFATLFLNRTNRSGILKGGVIGGLDQAGVYKLDARMKKDMLRERIERIARYAGQITVYCEDALDLLGRSKEFLPTNALIYLDPPYYVQGRGLYRNFYEHDDHAAIARLLQSRVFRFKWVVSYDNAQEICDMYRLSQGLEYGLHYTAQKRYVGNEVMFFSKGLKVPEDLIPQAVLAA